MPKPLTDFERGLIVGLMLAKVSVSQAENILKENNMVGTQRTIQRVFKQWQDEGKTTVSYQDNCGRPSKLNEGDQQQLKQFVLQNPIVSRRELANNVTANPKQVSGQTLYKSLQDQGLFQISLQRKISISQKNKDLRVKWARKLLRNMKSQFKHTIFTDETTIIFQNERKTLCWVDTNSDNKQEKAIEYQRFPKKCMIWGAINYEGALDLQFVEDIKKLIRTSISNIKSSLEKLIELKGDAII
ncbi:hypothetical protein ABPG72_009093 [Tetrahymena utriculariae]